MTFARFFAVLALALGALGLWPGAAAAQQPVVIRLGHVGFPGSLFDLSRQKFAQEVNQALKGKVEVRVFHSSQLGSDEAMIKGIRVSSPEMQTPSTVMSTVDQRYGVFEMPYLIVSRAHMKKAAVATAAFAVNIPAISGVCAVVGVGNVGQDIDDRSRQSRTGASGRDLAVVEHRGQLHRVGLGSKEVGELAGQEMAVAEEIRLVG